MKPPPEPTHELKEQAIAWVVRRHSGTWSAADAQALEDWLARSAVHRQTYEQVQQLWTGLGALESRAGSDLAAARAGTKKNRWPFQLRTAAAVALGLAGVLVFLVVATNGWFQEPKQFYRTAKGERQSVTLDDGSRIELNTDTALTVRYSRQGRVVQFERGEAFFTVVHDRDHPFEVLAGRGRIRDLGTQFDVLQRGSEISVAVLDGRVDVATTGSQAPRPVNAGYWLAYGTTGELRAAEPFDRDTLMAWREGKLVFRSVALKDMVEQITRYHDVSILVLDPTLKQLKVSGSFGTEDLALMLTAIETTLPVKITRVNAGMILIAAADDQSYR